MDYEQETSTKYMRKMKSKSKLDGTVQR